jgi:NAD(P)-dependent dehydrogenase (short-subunit alcohol dehydrogenase family)
MKIVVIGAAGTIGRAVVAELASRHEIVAVGKTRGQYRVDVVDIDSVRALFAQIGSFDAVVTATGSVHFGPLAQTTPEQFQVGLKDKLMGQINVVLAAQNLIADGGSFTLTSGILAHDPVRDGVNATTVNTALEGFALAAAIELPRGVRINVVSPNVLEESLPTFGPYMRGFEAVSAQRVGLAFSRSVEGAHTGRVYRVW